MSATDFKRLLIAVTLTSLLALAGSIVAATQADGSAGTARHAAGLATRADRKAAAIQYSRRQECEDTNSRHRATVARLNRGLAQAQRSKANVALERAVSVYLRRHHGRRLARLVAASQRSQLQESKNFTLALIGTLAPLRDCNRLAG